MIRTYHGRGRPPRARVGSIRRNRWVWNIGGRGGGVKYHETGRFSAFFVKTEMSRIVILFWHAKKSRIAIFFGSLGTALICAAVGIPPVLLIDSPTQQHARTFYRRIDIQASRCKYRTGSIFFSDPNQSF